MQSSIVWLVILVFSSALPDHTIQTMYICSQHQGLARKFIRVGGYYCKKSECLPSDTTFRTSFTGNVAQEPKLFQCHGESGIPELLYPHTKFPSEYCTPVHDSLVNLFEGTIFVQWTKYPVTYPLVDIVSPYHPLQNAITALDGCFNTAKKASSLKDRLSTFHS